MYTLTFSRLHVNISKKAYLQLDLMIRKHKELLYEEAYIDIHVYIYTSNICIYICVSYISCSVLLTDNNNGHMYIIIFKSRIFCMQTEGEWNMIMYLHNISCI